MNGFISVAEVRAEPKQPGFITVHTYGSTVTGTMPYLSGYGTVGTYYKLAIEYDNDNPYKYVDLYVTWTP